MPRSLCLTLALSAATLALAARPAGAQVVFLQNDSYVGGPVSCYTGIGNDEGLGSKLTAAAGQYPYTIDRIRVFGCGGGQDAYIVTIHQDNGSLPTPGPLIWQSMNAYFLSGFNTFNDILMSDEPVPPPPVTSGSIRVSLVNISILAPIGFGADTAIIPQRNFLRTEAGVWSFAETHGVAGDWILRLGIIAPGATPTLSILDTSVTEGNAGSALATFTVTLSPAASGTVTVQFATADDTATAPGDYQATSGTLTFAPGDTVETFSVAVNGDLLNEADETFLVNLTNLVGATMGDSQGLGTITNDDPLPSLTVSDATVAEGDAGTVTASFTVGLSAPSGRTVTVNYATANGTAVAPGDYLTTAGMLVYPSLTTSQPVSVTVNGDTLDEVLENFAVNLSGATNASVADGQGLGLITDDEVPGADFNADGMTDILWRHQVSGQNVVWLMNGVNLISGHFTDPPVLADTNWRIVGTNDFNNDEKTDILFRHAVSGQNVIWHMNGLVRIDGSFTTPPELADTNWRMSGTGDFNSDGSPDILWHHALSGQIAVWRMNDTVMTSGTFTTPSALPDTNWRIVGSGDFNRDAKADILWHHAVSGQIAVWYMDGVTRISGVMTTPSGLPDTNWNIMGTGDFNLDTKPDILWRHAVSGQIAVWHMDGVTLLDGQFTSPESLPDLNWKIVGPR